MGNFEVYGDQKTLTQWDVGRKVAVAQKCDYIHFANAAMSEAVACKVREDDGLWIAEIPDEVLQVSGVLRVYAFVVTAGENYTKYSQNLFIRARPKPDNYLYTPTTGVSWEAMIGRVEELEEKTAQKPVYTAEEVGARPDTWIPTADDVGARPNTWLPTIADIGAAPSIESTDFPGCYYRTVNGKVEWVNPPFKLGVEYLTTERWDGKAVFAKLLDLGSLPANNTATYDGSLTTATKVHYMELLAYNSGYQYIPLAYDSGITSAIYNRGSARFVIKTNTTYNNIVNVYLKVKYTDNR